MISRECARRASEAISAGKMMRPLQCAAQALDIGRYCAEPTNLAACSRRHSVIFGLLDHHSSMSLFPGTRLSSGPRRCIVVALVFALLFAGFAQAAHFHKDELAGYESQSDIHCLLCLYAAGTAGPPAPIARATAPLARHARAVLLCPLPYFRRDVSAYQGRGPPAV